MSTPEQPREIRQRGLYYEELETGVVYRHAPGRTLTESDNVFFSALSMNPQSLHLDAAYAATTVFKRPVVHGILATAVFSKVLGTDFPGHGSIYLSQQVEFLRPVYVDTDYEARFRVLSTQPDRHTAEISTEIYDRTTDKLAVRGRAVVLNPAHF